MRINRKQKLFTAVSLCLMVIAGIYLFYFFNRANYSNILLITIDALRPDHLGCYGYKQNTSPNIDKLAEEGILFTQAISQSTWTGSSLPSLLTATYPSTHKITNFGCILDKNLITLAQILKKENYYTAVAFGDKGWLTNFPGLDRGFDYIFDYEDVFKLTKDIKKWINNFKDRKFFLWIHFYEYPHAPYRPPYPFNRVFITNDRPKYIPIGKGKEFVGVIPEWVSEDNIADINYYLSQYDGEIAFVDSLIGEILDTLRNRNLYGKTIIIISADHGESLGERNIYFQHGDCLYNEEINVPLIIKGNMLPSGMRIKYPVELIDIMPSLFEILRIKLNINIDGLSFYPLVLNKNKKFSNPAFSEIGATKIISGNVADAELRSVLDGEWKLIYETSEYGIRYELYNLKDDPQELNNLIGIEKERFELLKAKLEEWMSRPKPNITPLAKPLDEQAKERLKGLGYLQ